MSVLNFVALVIAVLIFVAAFGVAWYKWYYNTKADFSPRDYDKKKKEEGK